MTFSAGRWERVKEVFHQALTLPAADRQAFVAAATPGEGTMEAEISSLLEAHEQASGFLDDPAVDLRPMMENYAGRRIGHYLLERPLGAGGMGAVYLANREMDGYAMPVAVKLIRAGGFSESVARRFRNERQILARLHHPNITQLLDGGVTPEGMPYLVMEYVAGQPLDGYLRSRPVGLAERLRLFLEICAAVGEAHRNLIVHGDLKPSNVLVTGEGQVKLLDFGISRLLGEETEQATMQAMTPAWASPEQLRGEAPLISTDSYALGRLLYFLLTGTPAVNPAGRSPHEVLEWLQGSMPVRPSRAAVDPELMGDLDNIALKALEFAPEDRYRTAELLADDVRAHLGSRPISARSHTWRYRTQKFVKRNRGVVAGVGLVALAVLVGLGTTLWQARIAQRNYERAERRFADVRRLANSFLFEMDESIAKLPGSTSVRGTLVRNGLQYLDSLAEEAEGDISLREELAAAYEKVGEIQGRPGTANLGDTGGALRSCQKALAIREALAGIPGSMEDEMRRQGDLASTYVLTGSVVKATGDINSGLEFDRKALAIRQRLLEQEPGSAARRRALAASYTALGGSLSQLGEWKGVMDVRRLAIEQYQALVDADPDSDTDRRGSALAQGRMGSILLHEKQGAAALKLYRRALDTWIRLAAKNPQNLGDQLSLAQAHTGLGRALLETGDATGGWREFVAGLSSYDRLTAQDPREARGRTLRAANLLFSARAQVALGNLRKAARLAGEALAERERLSAENPANAGAFGEVAEAHEMLGDVRRAQGSVTTEMDWRRAREMYLYLGNEKKLNAADREALERIEAKLGKQDLR